MSDPKIVVLGDTGMLGAMLIKMLHRTDGIEGIGRNRKDINLIPRSLNEVGKILSEIIPPDTDWIVNCMGATKPYFDDRTDISIPIYANGLFPHQLAQWAEFVGIERVLHITTDCVYDGQEGMYDEADTHTPTDLYGKSKGLGEPLNCMTIRTSIIGPEFNGNSKHFLSWVKSLEGSQEPARGFINHLWNGLTTLELSYAIVDMIGGDIYEEELYHLFSSDISKYEMVKTIIKTYGIVAEVEPYSASTMVDRRLRTLNDMNDIISPSCFESMIQQLKEWEDNEEEIEAIKKVANSEN